jgi:hypothetical protein
MADPAPNDPLAPEPLLPEEAAAAAAAAPAAAAAVTAALPPSYEADIKEMEELLSTLATRHTLNRPFAEHMLLTNLAMLTSRCNVPERFLKFECMYEDEIVAVRAHHSGGQLSNKHLWELPLTNQDEDSIVELPPIVSGLFPAELQCCTAKSYYIKIAVGKIAKQLTPLERSNLCQETLRYHTAHPHAVAIVRAALTQAATRPKLPGGLLDIKHYDLYDQQQRLYGGVKESLLNKVSQGCGSQGNRSTSITSSSSSSSSTSTSSSSTGRGGAAEAGATSSTSSSSSSGSSSSSSSSGSSSGLRQQQQLRQLSS